MILGVPGLIDVEVRLSNSVKDPSRFGHSE